MNEFLIRKTDIKARLQAVRDQKNAKTISKKLVVEKEKVSE